jgi:phosphatidylserine/phosphatidylglycerophosphate/cardiolipin synthase-like enzyme
MSTAEIGVASASARLVNDSQYYDVAKQVIGQSHRFCVASVFIIDLKAESTDHQLRVYRLLQLLQQATWRGVQTRLLIGGSRENLLIAESAEIARYTSLQLGINCKWLTSMDIRGSHCKLLLADDFILTGSHNWSTPAFTNQIQDSVLLESKGLSAYFMSFFDRQWNRV